MAPSARSTSRGSIGPAPRRPSRPDRAQVRGIGREELLAAVDAIGLAGVNPAGTVVFRRNGRVIGRVGLVGGTASFVLPRRLPARGRFVASFQGNARFGGSSSALLVLPG